MEAERQRSLSESGTKLSSLAAQATRREVPDLSSWLYCFSLYAAAVCAKYPSKVKEMFAYQALIIGEAHRCGGKGWLMYNVGFRQQISSLEAADFSKLNHSLFATTMLAYGSQPQPCPRCNLPDHTQDECALNPNRAVPIVQMADQSGSGTRKGKEEVRRDLPLKKKPRQGACFGCNKRKPEAAVELSVAGNTGVPSALGTTPEWYVPWRPAKWQSSELSQSCRMDNG